jgi:hypothetical protein
MLIIISGIVKNTAGGAGAGTYLKFHMANGTAPAAGNTFGAGVQIGREQRFFLTDAADQIGFSIPIVAVGWSIGQALWFDLMVKSTVGSNAYVQDLSFVLIEI